VDKVEIVRKAMNFDTSPEEGMSYYADNFQWTDSVGSPPFDKQTWFGMDEIMRTSFPDISYEIEELRQDGEDVVVKGHFEGTFEKDLDLSAINMGVIPATGKKVIFPYDTSRVSFDADNKIVANHNLDTGPDAGMAGFMKALGAG
jgi:predicted ester cyclase